MLLFGRGCGPVGVLDLSVLPADKVTFSFFFILPDFLSHKKFCFSLAHSLSLKGMQIMANNNVSANDWLITSITFRSLSGCFEKNNTPNSGLSGALQIDARCTQSLCKQVISDRFSIRTSDVVSL